MRQVISLGVWYLKHGLGITMILLLLKNRGLWDSPRFYFMESGCIMSITQG